LTALPGVLAALTLLGGVDAGQVQPAGVDLRVEEVHRFLGPGVLGAGERRLPDTEPLEPRSGWWSLGPGAYKVVFMDGVSVPSTAVGLCFPRSSLLRSGVLLGCAVWDPGYRGRGEALLLVANEGGFRLERGARVAQLVYLSLGESWEVYRGRFLGERLG
jgi:dUTP pyrophosphatase